MAFFDGSNFISVVPTEKHVIVFAHRSISFACLKKMNHIHICLKSVYKEVFLSFVKFHFETEKRIE